MDELEQRAAAVGITDLAGVFLATLLELDDEQGRLQLGAVRTLARFFGPARRLNLAVAERCRTWLAAHLVDLARDAAAARYWEILEKLGTDEAPPEPWSAPPTHTTEETEV